MRDILKMTAIEVGEAIRKGEITSVEATSALLDAIEAADSEINAYITVCREAALEQAKKVQKLIESGELSGPLAGVPIAIKDNICTKGVKTSCASKILGDFKPPYDATVITRLEEAGMVVVGKLNMDEFAMGSTTETSFYGATKNPWDKNKVPGGSSGGAAAAVAAGEAFCALGSDTGGSIRQPASYCGVTGFKPTYGTVSRYGLIAYASSLDQIGPVARDVRDCAAIMDIIKGKDCMDGTSIELEEQNESYLQMLSGDVSKLRVALPKECFGEGVDDEVRSSVLLMAEELKKQGAEVTEISLPFIKYVIPTYYIMATAEASSNLSRFDGVKYGFRATEYDGLRDLYEATRSEGFGEEVKKRILLGTFVLSSGYYDAYYKKALQVKSIIKEQFDSIFEQYDVIICPTAPATAPTIGESLSDSLKMYLSDIFTVSPNIAGLPALSVPCGFDRSGMPIGAQIIGPRLGERNVLGAGYAYQQVTDFHKRNAAERSETK
ncbi:MAG: Asp-tRNA(Asn)/Glu-tRNA(Gln) amidotransferase subunit GatA [Oscillospiraceae bacterium]|jgi:aspartyl-tRNA(Asn)/glutamyl-tRNA(Gln) amidotransferase subunit A|nr:Asp-tRNA(Asn)/Glu-tRNA(Gln) amidotransferase subunit GatA [Oscillospiraceae bacterium]